MELLTREELILKLDKIFESNNSDELLNELIIEYPYIKTIYKYKVILLDYLVHINNK